MAIFYFKKLRTFLLSKIVNFDKYYMVMILNIVQHLNCMYSIIQEF